MWLKHIIVFPLPYRLSPPLLAVGGLLYWLITEYIHRSQDTTTKQSLPRLLRCPRFPRGDIILVPELFYATPLTPDRKSLHVQPHKRNRRSSTKKQRLCAQQFLPYRAQTPSSQYHRHPQHDCILLLLRSIQQSSKSALINIPTCKKQDSNLPMLGILRKSHVILC
jgi:hypothetical protein